MKQILKQVLGVDVAKEELVASLGRLLNDLSIEIFAYKVFSNNKTGINELIKWVNSLINKDIKVQYVMEATGIYYEKFAYFLDENGYDVSVVLPNKISNYMRTLSIKTITDKTCSEAITRFGLERKLDLWHRPEAKFKKLKQLTRERDQILDEQTMVKNQLHAETNEAEPCESTLHRLTLRIEFLTSQKKEIEQEIKHIVHIDKDLTQEIKRICTIPGVGELTAVIVLAETNNFELIRNKKQLTSYAGLDVREKQSGTSIKGKATISKRGNKSLRKAMYFPAISAVTHNQIYQEVFQRIFLKSGVKMKGFVAIQRKILELIYIIHKTKTPFQSDYEQKRANNTKMVAAL